MNLNRTALTDLLPGEKDGFHSAILTTFSFDFYFFERILLSRLRAIGVRNVVVLADATMLHEATRHSSGFGSHRTKSYNLVPIHADGAFHPKMVYLLGEKSGWLAVGSGNITESGHGKNDEVWGTFYYSTVYTNFEGLFSSAWDFVKIVEHAYLQGFAKEQIAAAIEHAPWVLNLPKNSLGNKSESPDGCNVQLIHTAGDKSVWEQLIAGISATEVANITICSPFFDREGALLQKLSALFPGAKLQVVLEPDWGQLPYKTTGIPQEKLHLFGWKNLLGISEDSKNHWLHAKLFVFESKSQGNFCLFGSSNATPAGFGLNSGNHEMNILLHSTHLDFLQVLGLHIDDEKAINLKELANDSQVAISSPSSDLKFETIITAAELDAAVLKIYTSNPIRKSALLVTFNAEGLELQSAELLYDEKQIAQFKYCGKDLPYTCQIVSNPERKPLSNRQIVAHLADLRRTNPNPARAKFESLLDRLRDGENAAIADILSLIDLEMPEPVEHLRERGLSMTLENNLSETVENHSDVELTVEEFTQIPHDHIYRSHYLHFDPAHDLSDFLLKIGANHFSAFIEIDGDDDEEMIDPETGERTDGAPRSTTPKPPKNTVVKEAHAVKSFLERFRKALEKKREGYLTMVKKNRQPEPITTRELSVFLIALRLMIRYGNRKSDETRHNPPILPFKHGILTAWKAAKMDSIQIACYEIIGKFLLLLNSGIPSRQTNREQNRIDQLMETILYDLLFIFGASLPDTESDEHYIPIFYYNVFLHFGLHLPDNKQILKQQLEKRAGFGCDIPESLLTQTLQNYNRFLRFFREHLENKNLNHRHLIKHKSWGYLVLERPFGVSLTEDKSVGIRYHPGGIFDGKAEYYLEV